MGDVTVSGTDGGVNAYAYTSKSIAEVNVGDRIRILHDVNDWAQWKTRTVDKVDLTAATPTAVSAVSSFTVDLAYGTTADNNFRAYNDQRGTTEESSCSKRGLCDESSGTCQCFKGYTDDDCSRQNALAA